ncbi:tol-pal system protein YbgF [Hansschlegelia quercus]|uniref:Cell division coordinator CpoB n=1 Tax=Hansschlegelia quercus TaxID=2528245 RepID=A0A4Q9GT30_9HYPH|nr:tol-pal system protein YbgF [Hansschlegelia quercus]TBN54957.1 tol-pal system protein YbgF [Hansschlegelia quercus]
MNAPSRFSPLRLAALGLGLACAAPGAAFAQAAPAWLSDRVDQVEQKLAFFGSREARESAPPAATPAQASSMADIAVRLDRIENQMRTMNGRIEQLEFQGRKNDEGLKRMQGDVDFRLQDLESGKSGGAKPQKRGDAADPAPTSTASTSGQGGGSLGGSSGQSGAGARPADLGSTRSSDAIGGLLDDRDDSDGPMRITPPGAGGNDRTASRDAGGDAGVLAGAGGPRDQFDLGVGFIQRRDYPQAEATFRDFLRQYPKDAKAPEAQYWLGESLYQRKKFTDAAENFLAIYNSAPQSPKAPESMLKLGMSLNGMGQKEQACAAIAEAGKKYARIKPQSDRELKRIAC